MMKKSFYLQVSCFIIKKFLQFYRIFGFIIVPSLRSISEDIKTEIKIIVSIINSEWDTHKFLQVLC